MQEQILLFVGSNPSNVSIVDIAFHGSTQSSKVLTEWIKNLNGMKIFINVVNNRPLKKSEIVANLLHLSDTIKSIQPTKIIAIGRAAGQALTLLHLDFFEMPRPSGRNLQINDKEFINRKLKELAEFCALPALQ